MVQEQKATPRWPAGVRHVRTLLQAAPHQVW